MRARSARRGLRILLGVVAAATLVDLAPPAAEAQDAGGALVGIQGRAAASGLHALYNPAGVLPLPPPVDLGAPDALATIASGPATFARAAVADPGDLLASPDALLAQAAADYPAGTIPPWPLRISATSGVGPPSVDSNPAPGLQAHVEAGEGTSSARATMPGLDAPAVARVGSMSAVATTETDGSTVTVRSRATISEVEVLGLLTIGSVVTDLTATSDGTTSELTGRTTLVDATLLGTPVTIDEDGIHPAGQPPLLGGILGPLVANLDDLLGQAGIRITVAAPVETGNDETGLLVASGLRIDLELSERTVPVLEALLDAVPSVDPPIPGAPGPGDVVALARARHLVSIDVGRGVVSLTARAATPVAVPATDRATDGGPGSSSTPAVTPTFGRLPSTPPGLDGGATGPDGTAASRTLPASGGVGAVALLALLAQPLVGDRIARAVRSACAPDRPTSCPRERP